MCGTNTFYPIVQVTVYGRARLGQDVFLGEVVIPLREVEATADASHSSPDIRRYILGRRNAKEKVLPRMVNSFGGRSFVNLRLSNIDKRGPAVCLCVGGGGSRERGCLGRACGC